MNQVPNTKSDNQWRAGKRNLITDVPGLLVGNADDKALKSGVTVLSSDKPFLASVDVMGGAPGSRETELLAPDKMVEQVDALVLSGGSAFGLDAASGVSSALRKDKRGFSVGPVQVPIVPCAIIFDLINGGDHQWEENPYSQLGRQAYAALQEEFAIGSAGAGIGATTASIKGGLGSASLVLPDGLVVGALVVANPHGHVCVPGSQHFWAAPFEIQEEFGGLGVADTYSPLNIPVNNKFKAYAQMYGEVSEANANYKEPPSPTGLNTTIAIVATNAKLNKAQLKRMAVAAQDGMSRAIVPSHTPVDGDLIFAVSTNAQTLSDEDNTVTKSSTTNNSADSDAMLIGHAASVCLSRAIARGIYSARSLAGDTLPSWHELYADK